MHTCMHPYIHACKPCIYHAMFLRFSGGAYSLCVKVKIYGLTSALCIEDLLVTYFEQVFKLSF